MEIPSKRLIISWIGVATSWLQDSIQDLCQPFQPVCWGQCQLLVVQEQPLYSEVDNWTRVCIINSHYHAHLLPLPLHFLWVQLYASSNRASRIYMAFSVHGYSNWPYGVSVRPFVCLLLSTVIDSPSLYFCITSFLSQSDSLLHCSLLPEPCFSSSPWLVSLVCRDFNH